MRSRSWSGAILALAVLTCAAVPAAAHHSYLPKYDPARKMQISGVITSVNYQNPHIFFSVAVKTSDGSTVEWTVETESISLSQKAGLSEAQMPVGGSVTLTGWQARSRGPELGLATYQLRRGRRLTIRRTPR